LLLEAFFLAALGSMKLLLIGIQLRPAQAAGRLYFRVDRVSYLQLACSWPAKKIGADLNQCIEGELFSLDDCIL
jgi:hypothetical protein